MSNIKGKDLEKLKEIVRDRETRHAAVHVVATSWRKDRLLFQYSWASLVAQMIKDLPAMRETGI